MSKLFSLIRRAPKRFSAAIAIIAAMVIVPAALNAWGGSRTLFTTKDPAPYVTFNSIKDNPAHGFEPNFMQVREATASNETYTDHISLSAGKEYVVYMYYHNNAASNLNASGVGIAHDAYVRAAIPALVKAGGSETAGMGYVGARDAKPKEVYDDIFFKNTTGGDISLRYVPGSATIHNKGKADGNKLSDTIVTSGATIGHDSLNGVIPGCNEYAGYITFRVKADQPNFEVSKKVKINGTSGWKESVEAQPGDTVDYLIEYNNTGTMRQNNVTVKDKLPQGMTYVNGSARYFNTFNPAPTGAPATDDVTGKGLNIGNYEPGSNGLVRFSAKVPTADKLKCGENKFVNTGIVETDNGWKQDTADVIVKKECQPEPKYTCDSLTVKKLDRTKFEFNTAYTVKDATFKSVEYVVRNANGTEVYRGTNNTFSTEAAGKYSIQSYVTVTVNGSDKTVTSESCKKEFEVVKPKVPGVDIDKKVDGVEHKVVGVNQEFVYQLTVTNTGDVDLEKVLVTDNAPEHVQFIRADKGEIKDNKWSLTIPELKVGQSVNIAITAKVTKEVSDTIKNTACVDAPQVPGTPDDCDDATVEVKIKVCELKSKTIIVIKKNDFDKSKHSTDLNDCTEMKVCDLTSKKIVTIKKGDFDNKKYSTNLDDCAETPVTPPELPTTGIGDSLSALLGLGSLVASVSDYIASRRSLGL